jgi:hypothetical protein
LVDKALLRSFHLVGRNIDHGRTSVERHQTFL